jgi:hypothetical protein
MSQLFFFTLRDVKFRNKTKYTGLIPKLYSHIYDGDLTIDKIIDYDRLTKNKKEDDMQKDTFKKLLNSNNSLKQSKYINKDDISKIISLNMSHYDDMGKMNKKDYLKLIEHLFSAHSTMEYGIYFGARKADSEKDFLDSVNIANPRDKNQTLLFYINADKLIEHIDMIKKTKKLKSDLLYFNMGWQYGVREKTSIVYNGNNLYDFICYIRNLSNDDLQYSETICQIPLPINIFKHTFKSSNQLFKGGSKKRKQTKKRSQKRKYSIKKTKMISKKNYDKLLKKKRLTKKERIKLDRALFVNYCKCIKKIKYNQKYPKGAEYPICISSIYKQRNLTPPKDIIKRCKKYR